MDIKAQITKIVDTITNDKDLLKQFDKEPVKVIEKLIGVDLPDDVVNQIIAGVKAKISVDKVSDAVDMLKKLF
ncbi:MAG: hypothetical protein IJZ34_14090 [Lachnospiraceae bacterium]|nr:hypothetical protein [Lachnospiraceae bacterium]